MGDCGLLILLIGLVAGVALGYAIGRQAKSWSLLTTRQKCLRVGAVALLAALLVAGIVLNIALLLLAGVVLFFLGAR